MRLTDRLLFGSGVWKRIGRAAAVVALLIAAIAGTASAEEPQFPIYYQGAEDLVLSRLNLDPTTQRTANLADARTAVFQDGLPAKGAALDALKSRVEAGMGLVIVTGRHLDPAALESVTGGALRQTSTVDVPAGPSRGQELERLAAVIEYAGPAADPIGKQISWRSAVRVHERSLLDPGPTLTVLVQTGAKDPVRPHTPVLLAMKLGKGTIYVLNVWLLQGDQRARVASYIELLKGIRGAENYDFQRWPYFNWLLYDLTRAAAGAHAAAFGDWVASPVPDSRQAAWLAVVFLTMFASFIAACFFVRRYSLNHPDELERLYLAAPAGPRPASLGAAAAQKAGGHSRGDPRWEIVGFHRPLSGFFLNSLLALFIMIPFNFVTTYYLDRNFVNPFLEARGAWAAVVQFMVFFFTLLDLGTGQAMVKYFAEYRVKEPGRAISYAQFFIWFHAIAGMFQITVLGLVAAIWMPQTAIAYLTWFVILHTLIQFPGFIPIFLNLYRALQRFDYAELIIVLQFVLVPITSMTCGIFMRHWGLLHSVFGEGMGVVFGIAIGSVIGNLLMGLFCAIFYHRMGYRLTTIFLAHFDRDTIRKSFVYGIKLTGGNLLAALSWGMIPVIMGVLLPNFLELNEIFVLTFMLTFGYLETGVWVFSNLMPSISESYSHGMMRLTRRYLDQGLRWGIMVTSMLGGAFVAFSGAFVGGLLPPQFMRAIGVMALAHLWRTCDFTTRLPDQVFQGVGRTGLYTIAAAVEHLSRIVLAWYLIKWYGFPGLFYAFMAASLLRAAMAWPLMAWLVASPAISVWQTLLNPALAALGNYLILRGFVSAFFRGPGHVGNAWLVVLFCLLASLPIYMLLTGLLGWDEKALAEFRDAAELVPAPFGAAARMAHRLVELGSRLSPLHDRFPGTLLTEAAADAAALTALKADLH
ncbi:MAG TPA: hypothetical protein VEC38_04695 [Candidatus Binataceae bacterium]|nr:hypothetical protein [Candidatus Binataceae bacterium]